MSTTSTDSLSTIKSSSLKNPQTFQNPNLNLNPNPYPYPYPYPYPPQPSTMDQLASGAAGLGRFSTTLGAWVATVVGLVMIGLGIYYMVKPGDVESLPLNIVKIEGTVTAVNGNVLNVSYSYNNMNYANEQVTFYSTPNPSPNPVTTKLSKSKKSAASNAPPITTLPITNPPISTPPITTPVITYQVGQKIDLYINRNNPGTPLLKGDIETKEISKKTVGMIIIIIAVVVISLSWLFQYFVGHNQNIATLVGGAQAIRWIR